MSQHHPDGGPVVALRLLDEGLPIPSYAHPGDAGADLATAVDVVIEPGERVLVPTGVAIALPEGYGGFVHPRSGLAARSGLTIVNAPGTVDAGYRGQIMVCLLNTDRHTPIVLRRGDLIAQLVVQPVVRVRFEPVAELPTSARGDGGHGSTGGIRAWAADTPAQQPGVRLDPIEEGDQP
ncbi:MAG: dUTP diphosphatase [Brooklawnia sp.]|uniref:dUTP diphosphatase n=1 Tax=Brooklawnia sp. TaxID=2699740 RepID=UPI003C737D29